MALTGSLEDFGLPDILQLIGAQRKSGELTLERHGERIIISFRDGDAVRAEPADRSLDECVGTRLVRARRLRPDHLIQAYAGCRAEGAELTQVLRRKGLADEHEIRGALEIEVLSRIYAVLAWTRGTYDFEPGSAVQFDEELFAPRTVQQLLMDGMRIIDEWPVVRKKLRSNHIVLMKVDEPRPVDAAADGDDPLGLAEDQETAPDDAAPTDEPTALEATLLDLIDGKRTVQDLIDRSLRLEFDVCRALYDLWNRGRIAPAFEGSLSELSFADLFQAIQATTASGRLDLESVGTSVAVTFREGAFFSVCSTDDDDSFATHLLSEGLLRRADIADLPPGDDALLTQLAARQTLPSEQLASERRRHARRLAERLFAMTDGSYAFREETIDPASSVALEDETVAIVTSGIKTIDRWSRLEREAGPCDQRLVAVPDRAASDRLDDQARAVLKALATPCSLAEADTRLDLPEADLLRQVWTLRTLGLLRSDAEPPAALSTMIRALRALAATAGDEPAEGLDEPLSDEVMSGADDAVHETRSGTVTGIDLADLFHELYETKVTGLLTVASDEQTNTIRFSHGTVIGASSIDPSHRLGRFLAELGFVARETIEAIVAEGAGRMLGQELLRRDLITSDQIDRAVQAQVQEIVFPMFGWPSSEWLLEEGELGDSDLPTVDLSTAEIIIRGSAFIDDLEHMEAQIAGELCLAPSRDERLRFQKARLQPLEGYLLSRMDGTTTVDDLKLLSPADEAETVHIIFSLVAARLVAPAESSAPEVVEAAPPPAAPTQTGIQRFGEDEAAATLAKMLGMPAHVVLGVDLDADAQTIDAAYRALAKKYHPDLGRTAREKVTLERIFTRIVEAGNMMRKACTAASGA